MNECEVRMDLLMNTILNEWMQGYRHRGGGAGGHWLLCLGIFLSVWVKKSLITLEGSQEFLTVNSIGPYFKDSILL